MTYIDPAVIMRRIDKMPPAIRALVREFGYVIVDALLREGHRDPFELAEILANWRARRQEEWLNTTYVTRKSAQSIADATTYEMARRRAESPNPTTSSARTRSRTVGIRS